MVEVSIYFYLKRGTRKHSSHFRSTIYSSLSREQQIYSKQIPPYERRWNATWHCHFSVLYCAKWKQKTRRVINLRILTELKSKKVPALLIEYHLYDKIKIKIKSYDHRNSYNNIPSQQYYSVNVTAILLEYFMLRGNVITTVSINLSFLMIFIFWSYVV